MVKNPESAIVLYIGAVVSPFLSMPEPIIEHPASPMVEHVDAHIPIVPPKVIVESIADEMGRTLELESDKEETELIVGSTDKIDD